ncbi:PREDICTED: FKBP12-interacting protein of 37 kDa isoform X1 [Tarenaya hassleriana]|uniref:FKBP12-interacting protein of 37 kDa isoform X1 n=1 Tax=Tarenaya hassleriana TaxID=28532 RepID=UPI00053C239F|nr:PREDICTED: FKBP12-interacting protein of 37 kDa isoform X1 [Tarenaya hassleriana]
MDFSLQDDDFGGDFAATRVSRASGSKRSFDDLEDDEEDIFDAKKGRTKAEEATPGVATAMILTLRGSLETCKNDLTNCQVELEAAKTEIQKWKSAFQNESFVPAGKSPGLFLHRMLLCILHALVPLNNQTCCFCLIRVLKLCLLLLLPEPRFVIDYIQNLKSSEKSLKEQLEIARRKEASCIVQYAKREQEMAELKSAVRDLKAQLKPASMQARRLLLDPAIHEEFTRLKNLVDEKDKKVKELQDNIAAVTFTPQSKMGKMLMAKCRTLQEENEEIGQQATEGKMQELAMKLAMQKSQNAELRSQFEELFKQMETLTNDVERSNETVIILQEKLEEKENEIKRLKHEERIEETQQQQQKIESSDAIPDLADKKSGKGIDDDDDDDDDRMKESNEEKRTNNED